MAKPDYSYMDYSQEYSYTLKIPKGYIKKVASSYFDDIIAWTVGQKSDKETKKEISDIKKQFLEAFFQEKDLKKTVDDLLARIFEEILDDEESFSRDLMESNYNKFKSMQDTHVKINTIQKRLNEEYLKTVKDTNEQNLIKAIQALGYKVEKIK